LPGLGLLRQAAEHFKKAAQYPAYELRGFAQISLCLKSSEKQGEAVKAFRRHLLYPVSLFQANKRDQPNNGLLTPANFLSIVINRGGG